MKYNTVSFIEKAKQQHGNKYDYSKTVCTDSRTKLTIICPEHGELWQRASVHLGGKQCPECAKKIRVQNILKAKSKKRLW